VTEGAFQQFVGSRRPGQEVGLGTHGASIVAINSCKMASCLNSRGFSEGQTTRQCVRPCARMTSPLLSFVSVTSPLLSGIDQWSSTWGTRAPEGTPRYLTGYVKSKNNIIWFRCRL
jgi:hypothetical protein